MTISRNSIFQDDLDSMTDVWDSHIIRPSRNQNVPSGRPNVMFSVPELYGTENYMVPVEDDEIEVCSENAVFRGAMSCDEDVYNMCILIMTEQNLTLGNDAYEALDLYLHLRGRIHAILQL